MANSNKHKRLRNFMLEQLDSGNCPGVEWIDRQDGTFKIPWYHFNKIDGSEISDKFKIFLEWAKHTGKYKEGDKPDYVKYKTQLRTALTKMEDFTNVSKETDLDPKRVYQFSNWSSPPCSTTSLDSTVVLGAELSIYGNPQTEGQDPGSNVPRFLQDRKDIVFSPTSTNNFDVQQCGVLYGDQYQILRPAVQTEEQLNAREPPRYQDFLENMQMDLQNVFPNPMDVDALQQAMQQSGIPNVQQLFDTKQEAMNTVDPREDKARQALGGGDFDAEYLTEDSNQACALSPNADGPQASIPLSPDLAEIPMADLVPAQTPMADLVLGQTPIDDLVPAQPPIKCELSGTEAQCRPVHPQVKEAETPEVTHEMCITLHYGVGLHKTEVMKEKVGKEGCRLYFGDKVFDNTPLDEHMYGSKTAKQLQMPSVEEVLLSGGEKVKTLIAQTLEMLSRGLLLEFEDGDIYAYRLGMCKMYTCDTSFNSQALKRDTRQKVFDYKRFQASLAKGSKKDSGFILTFGFKANIASRQGDPLNKVLVYAWVRHIAAEKAIEISGGSNSLSSLEPLHSDPNTLDNLEQDFRTIVKVSENKNKGK